MKTFILILVLFSITGSAPPSKARLAVNIVTHDEDRVDYINYYRDHFDEVCTSLLQFAKLCQDSGAVWHMGCSESIITAVEGSTATSTIKFPAGINNILEYLQDIYGVIIDVHTHDVPGYGSQACRLLALDVTPSHVMNGFTCTSPDWVPWTKRTTALICPVTRYKWKPKYLWGSATPFHRADPTEYGIWKPDSTTNCNLHNHANALWYYGDGPTLRIEAKVFSTTDAVTELENKLSQMARARVPVDYLYPTSIHFQESMLWEEKTMIDDLRAMIGAINLRHDVLKWISIGEAIEVQARGHGGNGFRLNADFSGFTVLH